MSLHNRVIGKISPVKKVYEKKNVRPLSLMFYVIFNSHYFFTFLIFDLISNLVLCNRKQIFEVQDFLDSGLE